MKKMWTDISLGWRFVFVFAFAFSKRHHFQMFHNDNHGTGLQKLMALDDHPIDSCMVVRNRRRQLGHLALARWQLKVHNRFNGHVGGQGREGGGGGACGGREGGGGG